MDDDDYVDIRERLFHNTVREYVIFLLIFLVLFILGSTILDVLRIKDREDYYSTDEEEATVYKVSMYLCVFALSVTICAALLLPASIASNEVLLLYPKSYYVKWLNHSLIQGIWNLVFLFSNVSLFGLLPFAYLFTESEGLSGCRRGMKSRVYETCTVLVLIAFIVFGLTYVISALLDTNETSFFAFKNFSMYYLPFLYSCISFLGVILLLIFTPLGFISLFGIVSRSLVKPQFLQDINEEYYKTLMEEDLIKRRLELVSMTGKSYLKPEPMSPPENGRSSLLSLQNGALQTGLKEKLEHLKEKREILQTQKETSKFRRNVIYPIAMLLLFLLTIITIFLVLVNSLMLLIGVKALPKSTAQFTLGITSLSKLGLIGAVIEVVVIFYLAVTSCVGLYSLPFLNWLRPRKAKTPLSLLIANCALLLILSSALPLLARILGITNFDLLGHYGKIEWLGNFNIVFAYNILFAGVTALCLFNKFTTPVCKELFNRIKSTLSLAMQLKGRSFLSTSAKNTPSKED